MAIIGHNYGYGAAAMNLSSLTITPEMLRAIAEIDEFKGAWRALKNLAPERLAALRRVATIESIGSSTRIEGAKLSDRDVEALLSRIDAASFASRDEQEVAGYAEVMEELFQSWQTIPLTENYVKQLHGMLLRHSAKDEHHRGQYKTVPNHVEAFGPHGESLGVVFETTAPGETPVRMKELVDWTRHAMEEGELHPLLIIGIFVVCFLAIHPFQDGNGRLSRILTTLLLLRADYGYVPYSSLENVIEQSKEGYYLALRRTQGTLKVEVPDWQPWLRFFLNAMQRQKKKLEQKMEREHVLHDALPLLAVQILDLVREHGRMTTGEIEKLTGESRGTIKLRLKELVEQGHLVRYGQGRSTWYAGKV